LPPGRLLALAPPGRLAFVFPPGRLLAFVPPGRLVCAPGRFVFVPPGRLAALAPPGRLVFVPPGRFVELVPPGRLVCAPGRLFAPPAPGRAAFVFPCCAGAAAFGAACAAGAGAEVFLFCAKPALATVRTASNTNHFGRTTLTRLHEFIAHSSEIPSCFLNPPAGTVSSQTTRIQPAIPLMDSLSTRASRSECHRGNSRHRPSKYAQFHTRFTTLSREASTIYILGL
jgi:hypothetical protein